MEDEGSHVSGRNRKKGRREEGKKGRREEGKKGRREEGFRETSAESCGWGGGAKIQEDYGGCFSSVKSSL